MLVAMQTDGLFRQSGQHRLKKVDGQRHAMDIVLVTITKGHYLEIAPKLCLIFHMTLLRLSSNPLNPSLDHKFIKQELEFCTSRCDNAPISFNIVHRGSFG